MRRQGWTNSFGAKTRKKVQPVEEQDVECNFIDLGALEAGCTECATDLDPAGSTLQGFGEVCCPPGLRCGDHDQDSIGGATTIPGDLTPHAEPTTVHGCVASGDTTQSALHARAYPRSGMATDTSTGTTTSDRFKEFRSPVRAEATTEENLKIPWRKFGDCRRFFIHRFGTPPPLPDFANPPGRHHDSDQDSDYDENSITKTLPPLRRFKR